jgi:hypothetical protein
MEARETAYPAITTPWSKRHNKNVRMSAAKLHPIEAAVNTAIAIIATGFRPNLSERAPTIKCVSAVATAYPAMARLTTINSTSKSLAMLGSEGTNMLTGRTASAERAINTGRDGASRACECIAFELLGSWLSISSESRDDLITEDGAVARLDLLALGQQESTCHQSS